MKSKTQGKKKVRLHKSQYATCFMCAMQPRIIRSSCMQYDKSAYIYIKHNIQVKIALSIGDMDCQREGKSSQQAKKLLKGISLHKYVQLFTTMQ